MPPRKRSSKTVAPVIRRKRVYAALALGVVCFVSGAVSMWRVMADRQRLQEVDAQVRISEPVTFRPGGKVRYRVQAEVTYTVNGQIYIVPASIPEIAHDREDLTDLLRRYGPGSTIPLLYNPDQPDDFEVNFGSGNRFYLAPLSLLGGGVLALLYVFFAVASDGRYHCASCGTGVSERHAYCFMCGDRIPRRKGKMVSS